MTRSQPYSPPRSTGNADIVAGTGTVAGLSLTLTLALTLPLLLRLFDCPFCVGPADVGGGKGDKLWHFVWMLFVDPRVDRFEVRSPRFDEHLDFRADFDLAFPPVKRPDPGNQLHAGSEPFFDQFCRETLGRFVVWDGAKDDDQLVRVSHEPSLLKACGPSRRAPG